MPKNISFYFVILFLSVYVHGQGLVSHSSQEASFQMAQEQSFIGNHKIAIDTLNQVLQKYPQNNDVRSLLAHNYSWDKQYQNARLHFNKLTSTHKNNIDFWVGAIKNELYANENYLALGLCNKAMLFLKENSIIQALKHQALLNLNTTQEEKDSKTVNDSVLNKNKLSIAVAYEGFSSYFKPMRYVSVAFRHDTKYGAILPRINYSNRFNTNGIQYELDAYPKITKKVYGYLNFGYSQDNIYPSHRAGAELYVNLPKAYEFSVGTRYLKFGQEVYILTGSFGFYKGNYYVSARPYITPQANSKTGIAASLLVRKYFSNKEHFIGVMASMGYAPELKQLYRGNTLLASNLLYIASQQLQMEYQFTSKSTKSMYKATLGLTRQELAFNSGTYFVGVLGGCTYSFNF